MDRTTTKRREATPAEFKAMAHPLRMRILRLCVHESLTNKEIADRLDRNPATVLHHVRILADTGFLRSERPRTGARGALEKPYRATGKSVALSADIFPADARQTENLAMIDALRGELIDSGPDSVRELSRLGLKLNDDAAQELWRRLEDLLADCIARGDDPDGRMYGLFVALHERT
ncbi:MAG: ArsR/SmtB family transcription factor [Acidimicrobiales bacterium]